VLGERVIVVDPDLATAQSIATLLTQHGYRVVVATSADEACRNPLRFECGVFSDQLPEQGGITLAGWLMAEERVGLAVFFGHDEDIGARLRASNLGTYVLRRDGIAAVVRATLQALGETRLAQAVGAENEAFRTELKTGARRRL
jgi:DNA-binding response OmpR family regulator